MMSPPQQDPNPNNNSLICRLSYKDIDFLFTGDLEKNKERLIADVYPAQDLESEILKVGHHGSNTSSSEVFLNEVNPLFAIISVAQRNRYHHPSPSVIKRLRDRGCRILRTDQDGAIEITTDGRKAWYKTFVKAANH